MGIGFSEFGGVHGVETGLLAIIGTALLCVGVGLLIVDGRHQLIE